MAKNSRTHDLVRPRELPRTTFQQQVLHVASLVKKGEWSTYGDVSMVVTNSVNSAQSVGDTIRKFGVPGHSRLLRSDGRVPDNYLPEATSVGGENQRPDPGMLRRMLESEDVRFTNGRADPTRRVSLDELRKRLDEKPYPASA